MKRQNITTVKPDIIEQQQRGSEFGAMSANSSEIFRPEYRSSIEGLSVEDLLDFIYKKLGPIDLYLSPDDYFQRLPLVDSVIERYKEGYEEVLKTGYQPHPTLYLELFVRSLIDVKGADDERPKDTFVQTWVEFIDIGFQVSRKALETFRSSENASADRFRRTTDLALQGWNADDTKIYYHLTTTESSRLLLRDQLEHRAGQRGVLEFGQGIYLSDNLEYLIRWFLQSRLRNQGPLSLMIFKVPTDVLSLFKGLQLNSEISWQNAVNVFLKNKLLISPYDFLEGPCCSNTIEVVKCRPPGQLKMDGVVVNQLCISKNNAQNEFFRKADIRIIDFR